MKNLLLLIVIMLMVRGLQSQTITFNKKIETSFPFLNITEVYPTDSCYYAIGVMTDSTGGLLTVGNIFTKLNLEGGIEWYNTLGTPTKSYETWGAGLISVGDSSFVTTGLVKDSIPKLLMIKYDLNGDTLLTRESPSPFYPEETFISGSQNIKPFPLNGFSVIVGVDADPNGANNDIYWLTLDDDLDIKNSQLFIDPMQNSPKSQLVSSEGDIIVGSWTNNLGQVNKNFTCRSHIFQIDTSGNIQWEYLTPSNELYSSPVSIHPTPDGGWVVGSGRGVEKKVNATSGLVEWYPCFYKLSPSRELEWIREFQSVQRSAFFAMEASASALDNSGYVGVSQITEEASLGYEILGSWLMKVSPEGDSLWVRHYSLLDSVPAEPDPRDIQATPDGGYIISGWVWPQVAVEQGFPPRYGWLLKVDEYGCVIPGCHLTTATETASPPSPELALYPNPARDFINFELRGYSPSPGSTYRILDPAGRVLRSYPAEAVYGTGMVDVSAWPAGTYVLQLLEQGEVRVARQFVKQ